LYIARKPLDWKLDAVVRHSNLWPLFGWDAILFELTDGGLLVHYWKPCTGFLDICQNFLYVSM
jgi:hypothetical protein